MLLPKNPRIKSKATIKRYLEAHPYCEWTLHTTGREVPGWLGPHHIIFKSQENGHDTEENIIRLSQKIHELAHGKDSQLWREKFLAFKASLS